MGGGLTSTCRVLPATCVVPYMPVGGSPCCLIPFFEVVSCCWFWRESRPAHVASPRVLPSVSTCWLIPHPVPWSVSPHLLAHLLLAFGGPGHQLRSCSTTLRDGVSTGLSLHYRFCCLSLVLIKSLTNYVGCIILVHHVESLPVLLTPFHLFFGVSISFTTISSSLHQLSRLQSQKVLRVLLHSNETPFSFW